MIYLNKLQKYLKKEEKPKTQKQIDYFLKFLSLRKMRRKNDTFKVDIKKFMIFENLIFFFMNQIKFMDFQKFNIF